MQHTFHQLPGVVASSVGYTGGHSANPTYKQVCYEDTGHAEAIKVEFDPKQISYNDLLEVFWECHNPTTMNRQGPDVGSQYRSAIFYANDEQKQQAEKSKAAQDASGRFSVPIVTEITAASEYYLAEDYHQFYVLKKRGEFQQEALAN